MTKGGTVFEASGYNVPHARQDHPGQEATGKGKGRLVNIFKV